MTRYVVDTSVLLEERYLIEDIGGTPVILSHNLRELEKHKLNKKDPKLAFDAREADRFLDEIDHMVEYDLKDYTWNLHKDFDSRYEDSNILQACVENQYGLLTNDRLLKKRAKGLGIHVISPPPIENDEYTGYLEVSMNDAELAYFYENLNKNIYSLYNNQYLVIKDSKGHCIDVVKWDGRSHVKVTERNLSTLMVGKFKPMDLYQKAAIDSLLTNDITLLRGKAGSGKSLVALNYALHQLEKGKVSRLVCLVNPYPVKNAQEIGFYKGSKDEKLMQSGIGNILISKIGDKNKVEAMIAVGEIILIPFVDIRGYDTGDDSIVWITEAQNLSVDLMKLGLQRIGKGSKIIIDGDDKTQVDNNAFAGNRNGIRRMSKVFRGTDLYGEIEFKTIYRSKIAEIADQM